MWRRLLLVAAIGCGRIRFDPLGDGGDGSVTAPRCNSITRVADDFEAGVLDSGLWGASFAMPGTSFAEAGGDLVLTLANNVAGAYVVCQSSRYYDLRDARVSVEVAQIADVDAAADLVVNFDTDNSFSVGVTSNMLFAVQDINAVTSQVTSIPFDPVAQRHWAIAEHAGTISFETSSDGVSFTSFATTPTTFDVSLVNVELLAGTDTAIPNPGEVRFAAVNGGVSIGAACPATSLVDRFDGTVSNHVWARSFSDACCTQSVAGGVLQFTTDGSLGYLSRNTSAGFDLRDSQTSVTIVSGPAGTVFDVSLNVNQGSPNQLDFSLKAGVFNAQVIAIGDSMTSAQNPGERYLRIRESGGTLYFEVSADNTAWRIVYQLSDPFPLDDVTLAVYGAVQSAPVVADQATFDDFGL
jgi:hypothetical protein